LSVLEGGEKKEKGLALPIPFGKINRGSLSSPILDRKPFIIHSFFYPSSPS
jgi:hypothetical protein